VVVVRWTQRRHLVFRGSLAAVTRPFFAFTRYYLDLREQRNWFQIPEGFSCRKQQYYPQGTSRYKHPRIHTRERCPSMGIRGTRCPPKHQKTAPMRVRHPSS
ncbi:unnamed protein product, partial [Ectocarpus fasciculatus]